MSTEGVDPNIQAAIEAAQLRAAANQYRLKLRAHQQQLRQIKTGSSSKR